MLRTLTTALLIWLVAFLFNLSVYTSGGELALNPWTYQVGLIILMIIATVTLTTLRQKEVRLPRFTQILVLTTVCIAMDIGVLLTLYARPVGDWLVTVLPVYLVIIPLNTRTFTPALPEPK